MISLYCLGLPDFSVSMETMSIKVAVVVKDSMERVWDCWTQAEHIKEWYHAADTWYVPSAAIDFKEGGDFKIKMAAIDKTGAFDFNGTYTVIKHQEKICFTIDDGRKVRITFEKHPDGVLILEQFEATSDQPLAAQEMGWQRILHSFKNYVEG